METEHGTYARYVRLCRCDDCRWAAREYSQERRERQQENGFAGRKHGTTTTYSLGCRCDECKQAARESRAERKKRRYGQPVPIEIQHGRYSTYTGWWCRCVACYDAADRYRRGER